MSPRKQSKYVRGRQVQGNGEKLPPPTGQLSHEAPCEFQLRQARVTREKPTTWEKPTTMGEAGRGGRSC